MSTDYNSFLPKDGFAGKLMGRVWLPESITGTVAGPAPVLITEQGVFDLSTIAATSSELIAQGFDGNVDIATLSKVGDYETIMANTMAIDTDDNQVYFLSPIDVQCIKACGVTFVVSMIERVIEERAMGDTEVAKQIRAKVKEKIGGDIDSIIPGSKESEELKVLLQAEGLWSQYLEVGIGPFAEVFTKSQPLSSVGVGAQIGVLPYSNWNNPEPEVVLIVDKDGKVHGAALGNDVNLRDIEGRSALLLGKAKDNNASCSIGPFIRLFDDTFGIDHVRTMEVKLNITGEDGFVLDDGSYMTKISRDVLDLVGQTRSDHHQYPDGFALFTGTLFAPTKDRDGEGMGFTHKIGDVVTISSDKLGALQNIVTHTDKAPEWTFGITALMRNLAKRELL